MTKAATTQEDTAAVAETVTGTVYQPGTDLALPTPGELAEILGSRQLPMRQWVAALVEAEQFEEGDEEDASLGMVRSILLAASSDEVFAAMNVVSVKDLIGDQPGAQSNVFEIRGAQPLKSTFEEGASAFAIITAFDMAEQLPVTLSTGARSVQAAIIAHQVRGWMPFKARFTRKRKPTRSGYYPLNLERGI